VTKSSGLSIERSKVLPLSREVEKAKGKENNFTALYRENHGAVRSLLFRFRVLDLEDLVQEVFLKAYRKGDAFRGEASPRTWLTRIAINVAKDHLKRSSHNLTSETLDPESLQASNQGSPLADTIDSCMAELNLIHREILILCAIEGFSMKEAADILEIPEGTIKSRLAAARQEMKMLLKAEGVES
jgi:RNA polymerase sigma-70 factor (ECF subfamily)